MDAKKFHDEQNIRILNKDRKNIADFFLLHQALMWLTIAPLLMLEGSGKELPNVL